MNTDNHTAVNKQKHAELKQVFPQLDEARLKEVLRRDVAWGERIMLYLHIRILPESGDPIHLDLVLTLTAEQLIADSVAELIADYGSGAIDRAIAYCAAGVAQAQHQNDPLLQTWLSQLGRLVLHDKSDTRFFAVLLTTDEKGVMVEKFRSIGRSSN